MMSKANSNRESNPDILRGGDIVPPYNDKSNQEDNSRDTKGSGQNTSSPQQKHEIPRFDLAEEILAEQRKIAAIRRKAPSRKSEVSSKQQKLESAGYAIEQPTQVLPEQQQIIAEIVARDIEKLSKEPRP